MGGGDEDEWPEDSSTDSSDCTSMPSFILEPPIVTTVELDLFLPLDESKPCPWSPDKVFSLAFSGLFDTVVAALCFTDSDVHSAGELTFAHDHECRAPPIDRHGSYLVAKKAKENRSNAAGRTFKTSVFGNSRTPSRASSRAQSRFSAALSNSTMVLKVARLAFGNPSGIVQADTTIRVSEWNEGDPYSEVMKPNSINNLDSYVGISSRYSLASSRTAACTSRIPVDFQEVKRRDEITHDIDTRECREKVIARIQRKGELKLKLRSMIDPNLSFDREEYEAQKKSRAGLVTRGGTLPVPKHTSNEQPAISRSNSVLGNGQLITMSSRSNETTYRSEDYEGLSSEVVILDKKGELLVGENCYLIARKPRSELQHDMLQRNAIKPRVHFPDQDPQLNQDESSAELSINPSDADLRSISRHTPDRTKSRQSPARPVDEHSQHNPVFEGHSGTLQVYPKIELDPKKTLLTKGVKIKPPESQSPTLPVALFPLKAIANPPAPSKQKQNTSQPELKPMLSEDHANEYVELQQQLRSTDAKKQKPGRQREQMTTRLRSDESPVGGQPSATKTSSIVSLGSKFPVKSHHGETHLLQNLRLRTPAYGNRNGQTGRAVLRISNGTILDDDSSLLHDAVDQSASLSSSNKLADGENLPRFPSYMREFPSPPQGQVHVVSKSAVSTLVASPTTKSNFPFVSLPPVVRANR